MPDSPEITAEIESALCAELGSGFRVFSVQAVFGGDMNRALRISCESGELFVKYNAAEQHEMFVAEAEALREIAATETLRVPRPLCVFRGECVSGLALEYLPLAPNAQNWALLGEQLAALHAVDQPDFGWRRDNTIGTTVQHNARCADWLEFWREQRLLPQLQLAQDNGAPSAMLVALEKLLDELDQLMAGHTPTAALLHGDLWAGNTGFLSDGTPVVFDPASYYGDRETDLAMSELFGGFGHDFYHAYFSAAPVADGYKTRVQLYQLYHVLNHFNLFGGHYAGQAQQLAEGLIAYS